MRLPFRQQAVAPAQFVAGASLDMASSDRRLPRQPAQASRHKDIPGELEGVRLIKLDHLRPVARRVLDFVRQANSYYLRLSSCSAYETSDGGSAAPRWRFLRGAEWAELWKLSSDFAAFRPVAVYQAVVSPALGGLTNGCGTRCPTRSRNRNRRSQLPLWILNSGEIAGATSPRMRRSLETRLPPSYARNWTC